MDAGTWWLSNRKIYVSPHVKHDLDDRPIVKSNLHLSVGVRAPRGRVLTDWIDAVLEGKAEFAQEALSRNRDYPVFITRDIAEMKNYLRDLSSPERRVGLLASAQARRLRSLGIEMSNEFQSGIHWPRWFIESEEDLRSSYSLEVAASEFKCQGLEIDWADYVGGQILYLTKKISDGLVGNFRVQSGKRTKPLKSNNRPSIGIGFS